VHCAHCETELPALARFCPSCGRPVSARAEAERRNLTVVFCDLVGSLALSTRLDPEDLRELIRDYQRVCADAVARVEGHIAQYLGDGVLAYFYPSVHEDDACRAVHAALDIVARMQPLAARWRAERGVDVGLRIGVHSGPTVVGDMGSGEQLAAIATGETPNIAARLQALAEPGAVVASGATHALVRGYFDCAVLGPAAIRGIDRPVDTYRVLRPTGAQPRLAAAAREGLLPLVGCGGALDMLETRWSAREGGARRVSCVQ